MRAHRSSQAPLIVGYSGGPDSTALVQLLLAAGAGNVHLAHFDHGWRKESAFEARVLQKKAERWQLPFWSERGQCKTRTENEARQARFAFFTRLYQELGASALILAHQKEDLAETALKRVFEGAHLTSLHGMQPVSKWGEMTLWRPLLQESKQTLVHFLEQKGINWLEDPTNSDPRYLRGKMRSGLMADLSVCFGKEIIGPLARLSGRSAELEDYLRRKAAFVQEVVGPFGTYWELPKERVEARLLLRDILKKREITWSHAAIEKALDLLQAGVANCALSHTFFIDRGLLFSIEHSREEVAIETTLRSGPPPFHSNWQSAWRGSAWVGLREEDFTLVYPEKGTLSKWWGDHKVPVCVRSLFPIALQGEKNSTIQVIYIHEKLL